MKRVLHIGKFFPPHRGGMEVFLADLLAEQHRQGIDAYALVHGDPDPHDPPWLVRVPVQCHLVYAPIAVGFRRALRQSIERLQPDVLHLHMPNNSALWVLTLAAAREIPWVVHWHSDVVDSRIRWAVALAYRLYRPFEQALLQRALRIIATSPPYLEASEPLRAWRDQCSIIPLGIDFDKDKINTNKDHQATPAAVPLPWQEGTLRLLSIGRLTYYKGFETLIQAVAPLENVELFIVGEGELRADLAALIQTLTCTPRVRLLGDVSDTEKTRLLQSCDLFCLASRERTEAFGIVLLEAMQYARPCLASALPGSGMAWVVQYTGAGLCIAAQDVSAWRSAIKQLHLQPHLRQRFGQAGQQGLQRDFSIATCARRVTLEYDLAAPEAGFHAALHPASPQEQASPQACAKAPATVATQGRTLIVIPARNEAASIGALLRELQQTHWHDVLVINDHSSDDTGAIAQSSGAIVLHPTLALGAWGAMQAGLRYALRHGYASVITMDADGQHEVGEIVRLLQAAPSADLVVGAYPERASRLRQIAWRWFQQLAGFDLRDLTSGFRLYNRAAMQVLASEQASLLDYQDLGALLLIRRAGLRIAEVPVKMNLRSVGQSRIFNSWFSVGRYMAATTLLCMARRPLRLKRPAPFPPPAL